MPFEGAKLAALALTLSAPPALAAIPQEEDALAARLDRVIDAWVLSGRIAGAVVLVARDGELVYRRAAGYADREREAPVREDTIFRLASMTKTIVAATALALVEEGKLRLDDPVAHWLPYFTPALPDGRRPPISIRQLMSHTSGLTHGFDAADGPYRRLGVSIGLDDAGITLEENLRRLAQAPLVAPPGSRWGYSISTDVLGAVVAKAAGMPLAAAVRHYVTGPLGMHDTAFFVVQEQRLAAAYKDGDPKAIRMRDAGDVIPMGIGVPFSPRRALDPGAFPSGGAGMNGTAGDYLRLLEAIRRGGAPILSPKSAARLAEHAIGELRAESEGPGWGFSLGAAVLLDPDAAGSPQSRGTWYWGGVLGGYWFVDPVEKLSVVSLTNTTPAGVIGPFPDAIRDAVYGR